MTSETDSEQAGSAHTRGTGAVSPLQLPSMTTAAFLLIVAMTVKLALPMAGGIGGVVSILLVLGMSLRLYAELPARLIARFQMVPLDTVDPELNARALLLARSVGLRRMPTFLSTKHPRVRLQTFGVFRRSYVVVNQRELEEAGDSFGRASLETMLIHELGHIQTGDIWKLQYAAYILLACSALALYVLVAGITTRYALTILLMNGPVAQATLIANLLTYVLIVVAMLFTLRALQRVREAYADAFVVRALGADRGPGRLVSAGFFSARVWAAGPPAARLELLKERLRALAFGEVRGPSDLERLAAIAESVELGAPLRSTMRQVVFAGGMAVGTQIFSPSAESGGALFTLLGLGLGGVYLGVAYLVASLASSGNSGAGLPRKAVQVALVFLAGCGAFWLLRIVSIGAVFGLSGVYRPLVSAMLEMEVLKVLNLILAGAALVLSLASAAPLIRRWFEVAETTLPALSGRAMFVCTFTHSAWVFAVIAVAWSAAITWLLESSSAAVELLWPLVLLLPLGACLTLAIRHLTSRPRSVPCAD